MLERFTAALFVAAVTTALIHDRLTWTGVPPAAERRPDHTARRASPLPVWLGVGGSPESAERGLAAWACR